MTTFIDPRAVTRTVLANGLTVLIFRNPAAPVAAVNTYVKAGYFDETDDIVGIAHVLEHMFFKGTDRFGVGEIAKATKAAGGYLNAHTIYDHTSYYAVLPSRGFPEGLGIQADAYANSVIDPGELGRELEVIIQEAMRKEDNPGAVTTETLYALLHDRHRIRRWRIGRPDQLRTFTRDMVARFYRNFYTPSSTILAIAGDVDPDETLARVQELYGALPAGEPERSPGPEEPSHRIGFRYKELSGDVEQTQVEIGWRTVPAQHPDVPALDLAANVLGAGRASRFYRAVRDRKLARSASAYNYSPNEVGVFVVSSEGDPATAMDAARALHAQVTALRNGETGGGEVERAQQLFASRWARHLETTEGQAAYLAEWESLGSWTLGQEYYDTFMRLTADDVTRVARRYLTPDDAGVVVYRPASSPGIAASAEEFRAQLDASPPAPLPATEPLPVVADVAPVPLALEKEEAGVRVYRMPSGIPVLVRVRPGASITHMGVYAAAGAAYEPPARAGITALAARTASRATESRTALQIAEASELLGGSIGASVGSESFGWSFSVPTQNVERALELFADVVQHATLPDDAIETERVAMLADLAQLRDDMYRYPMRLVQEAAYDGHPYSIPAGGTDETLPALRSVDVRAWYREAMMHAPYVIAITGDVDADRVAGLVAARFGELVQRDRPALPRVEWPEDGRVRGAEREKAQSALAIAVPAPSRRDPERYAVRVLSSVASGLGGRFFEELRDRRSLAYTVHAFGAEHTRGGMFIAYIATSPEREQEARDGLLQQIADLRGTPVTDEELSRAKRYLLGMHDVRQERGGAVLGDMVDAWMFGTGLHEMDEFRDCIERVTADEILTLADRCFDPRSAVEGVVHGTAAATARHSSTQ